MFYLMQRSEMGTWFPQLADASAEHAEWLLVEVGDESTIIGSYATEEAGDAAFKAAYAAAVEG